MEAFYTYILKVNIALGIFWLFCHFIFLRDSFIELKRICLLTVLLLSFTYPFVDFSGWIPQEGQSFLVNYIPLWEEVEIVPVVPLEKEVSWENCLWFMYGIGVLILGVRLGVQAYQVCRFIRKGKVFVYSGIRVISLGRGTAPFSFFHWIFLNPADYSDAEREEILTHEKTHVNQWHSLDMLLGEILCILFWFNPFVWLLRRDIRQNLEFLADKKVVESGYNRKNYQYHLLRLSHQSAAASFINNFNVSQLKKRIVMMNKRKTSRMGLLKYVLLLPLTLSLVVVANRQALAEIVSAASVSEEKAGEKMRVKGKVTDEKNNPVPGAIVVIKNSTIGTVTDAKGEFVLNAEPGAILCVSHIGKGMEEISVKGKPGKEMQVAVVLKSSPQVLEGVEIIGLAGEKNPVTLYPVEANPEFPGGMDALKRFLAQHIQYPAEAREKNIQGKVWIQFLVDEKGKVTQPQVTKGVDPLLDQEALRVVKLMPDWKPAQQNAKPVEASFLLPLDFSIPVKQDKGKELIVVDGKLMPEDFNVNTLNPDRIESITVVKGEKAVTLYGESAKESGILMITIRKDSSNFTESAKKEKTNLFVAVDGKLMPEGFDVNSLSQNKIKSFTVLRGEEAVALYGEKVKGKDVLVITTKKGR